MIDDIDYCETCQHCELEPHLEPCVSCKTKYIGTPTKYLAKRHTNADRIRAMSDEELAEDYCKTLLKVMHYFSIKNTGVLEDAVRARLEWLKQPVEE